MLLERIVLQSYDKGKYTCFNSTWINYLAEYAEAFDYNEMPQCDYLRIPTTFPRFQDYVSFTKLGYVTRRKIVIAEKPYRHVAISSKSCVERKLF